MKFEKGEIAVIAPGPDENPDWPKTGDEVEIVRVGPFRAGERSSAPSHPDYNDHLDVPSDYEMRAADGLHWFVDECNLRKRRPPIPDSVLSVFTTHKTGEPVDV